MASKVLPAVGTVFARAIRFVRFRYPSVPRIATEQLDQLMNDEKRPHKLVLLDVREPPEMEVSRLPESIPINPSTKDMTEVLSAINKKVPDNDPKTVVAYCAIGWRASVMAKRLMTELAKPENFEIRNKIDLAILEGSIFKWGNEGRVMVQGKDNKKATMVHGVAKGWEKLLHDDIRTR